MPQSVHVQYNDHPVTITIFSGIVAVARAVAFFLGGFSLLNMLGEIRTPGFDANLWWIDLHPLPWWPAHLLLGATALALLYFALRPRVSGTRRYVVCGLVAVLLLMALGNAFTFYRLLAHHLIRSTLPVPFSGLIGLTLLLVLLALSWHGEVRGGPAARRVMLLVFAGCLLAFPLAQIYCFGTTDYRRHADGIVVFGAGAHADGTPSRALADRVQTACRLYRAGYAPLLVFSGGPGEGDVPEPEVMRRMALRQGVPDSAILTDMNGLNTHLTVRNTCALFAQRHITQILAVSHFYHLPRVKMTYQRAGCTVYTVPAEEDTPMPGEPFFIAREVAALWSYYLFG